jgi:hypothetical protein
MFVIGWVLWFFIDKNPAALGTMVPGEFDSLLNNFQLASDMLKAGYLKASFVFIWKAHYFVIAIIAGLLSSIIFQAVANILRRRKLRDLMWPKKITPGETEAQDSETTSK